ncbi:phosphatidylinositol phosphate synthase [Arthrobacter sp. zg-Y1171]|uniref:phosphatidylinositol phosphate synthase n=1 Tax=unclassified Arthrobacter TaxID=235627 RepID=UPI002107ABCE|nr:CDP-alcohol phosphatidyltransferase family protein [Arthrobacter sp. zg-Y1171]MCQ1947170.1 CDP-alcohol phosphatidyltransferase family protein [Arthrobacter sp. zg-Y1116]MCQ1986678.1 CDP-alcohol phosphatidyltransferase family protein [Arthrobacter sp. zg-Y844]MCQ1995343.1 CDP-alcohol phosphatidyltransferase family protein [Arthrobacter sp. zg-Y1171]UWX80619.1 CDP-alcohol phosphatidyltransferase family protein [Arthrobacter sp. zg-Y1171]
MLNKYARGFFTAVFTPLATWLLRRGVTPDMVTIAGTLGVMIGGLVFYPLGELFWGTIFITVFIFSDVVDGIMARQQQRKGSWGGFLDSTLDRFADGALFAGVAIWFFTGGGNDAIGIAAILCLVVGMLVSYIRAKAESLGFSANVGIAERAERLVSLLVATGLVGLGVPEVLLLVVLILLTLASCVTIGQRMHTVRKQARMANPA